MDRHVSHGVVFFRCESIAHISISSPNGLWSFASIDLILYASDLKLDSYESCILHAGKCLLEICAASVSTSINKWLNDQTRKYSVLN